MIPVMLAPLQGRTPALEDLSVLLANDPKAVDEWLKSPMTRFVLQAVQELCFARTPLPGISERDHEYASAVIGGMQLACMLVRSPELIVASAGAASAPARPLPAPTYQRPQSATT